MARKKSATNKTIASNGYILVWLPDHPFADSRGYVYEHRFVLSEKIGRSLLPGEQVHHLDGNKLNNDPDNLILKESIYHHRVEHRKLDSNLRLPGEDNPIISCACGCGTVIEKYDGVGRPRSYISGHNAR